MPSRLVCAGVCALLLAACGSTVDHGRQAPPMSLDAGAPEEGRAEPGAPPAEVDPPAPAAGGAADPVQPPAGASEPGAPAPETAPAAERPTPGADPAFRVVGQAQDRRGDADLEAPAYADILQVTVEDDGTRARVTVAVAGRLPDPPADGEVLGVGVDFYTDPRAESAYQVYAVGNADGWGFFLQDANGLFDLPGEGRVGGERVVFELDWSHLGRLPRGELSAFTDWSRRRPVLNEAGGDRAPDRATVPFRR